MNIIDYMLELENINIVINIIKFFFINTFTYYTYKRIIDNKYNTNKIINYILIILLMFLLAIFIGIVDYQIGTFYSIMLMIISLSIVFEVIFKNKIGNTILNTIISIAFNYILFCISLIICFIINIIINIRNDYICLVIIIIIYMILINVFLNIKKLKKGIIYLKEDMKNNYFNIFILNLSFNVLFLFFMLINIDMIFKREVFIGVVIFSILMFISIQKSLQLYYKQKLLIQDLEETKKELEIKKKEIKELEKENLDFNKRSHTISHKQKVLRHKIDELMEKSEIASEIDIIDKVNELSKEISSEKVVIELDKTEIEEIDDVLSYMQSECAKNKIEFELQLNGNIHKMINNYVSAEDLQILIADHVKNAIIAIQYSNNIYKSIMVRLGEIDGCYSLYIYDSGIEFEEKTLDKLGKEPSTTHKDNGGTGMGFMNTFDTLNKYKASMTIKEIGKLSKDNYTKLIMIKFDNKNEFRIDSYRR